MKTSSDSRNVSSTTTTSARRAGFFVRLAAYFIDVAVIGIATTVLKSTIAAVLPGPVRYLSQILVSALAGGNPAAVQALIAIAQTAVALSLITSLYFLAEGIFGRALGKLALGLRVDSAKQTAGAKQTILTTRLVRYAAKNAGALLLFIGVSLHTYAIYRTGEILAQICVVGCLVALHRRRQALHDLIAGTAVVRAPRFGSSEGSLAA